MVNIGTKVFSYVVTAMANGFVLAESKTAPEPFVVWAITADGDSVQNGSYFTERFEAEWDFAAKAFSWFEDNMNITMIEEEEQLLDAARCVRAAKGYIEESAELIDEINSLHSDSFLMKRFTTVN